MVYSPGGTQSRPIWISPGKVCQFRMSASSEAMTIIVAMAVARATLPIELHSRLLKPELLAQHLELPRI